jgi:hypothetical protein
VADGVYAVLMREVREGGGEVSELDEALRIANEFAQQRDEALSALRMSREKVKVMEKLLLRALEQIRVLRTQISPCGASPARR